VYVVQQKSGSVATKLRSASASSSGAIFLVTALAHPLEEEETGEGEGGGGEEEQEEDRRKRLCEAVFLTVWIGLPDNGRFFGAIFEPPGTRRANNEVNGVKDWFSGAVIPRR